MNAKISVFFIYVETIIYVSLYNLHDCTFNRLNRYLGFEGKNVIINSFTYGNFNYCPLVWYFCSKISLNKIDHIQKRTIRFLLHDFESDYKTLLKKCNNVQI